MRVDDAHDDSTTERVGLAVTMLVCMLYWLFEFSYAYVHVHYVCNCILHIKNAGLMGICEEIDALNRLVQAAADAATNPGSLLYVDSRVKLSSKSGSRWTQRQSSKPGEYVHVHVYGSFAVLNYIYTMYNTIDHIPVVLYKSPEEVGHDVCLYIIFT